MRAREFINEAPLTDYQTIGNFEKSHSFRQRVDRKLVTNPISIKKIENFFANTDVNFRFFMANVPGLSKYSEHGELKQTAIQNNPELNKKLEPYWNTIFGDDDSITVIFTGNFGAERVPLTPWVMAHRIGHAIQATNRRLIRAKRTDPWTTAEQYFFKEMNNILSEGYGISTHKSGVDWDLEKQYSALFNEMGTQRSSRLGLINRPYEFLYEQFAQYIRTDNIKYNPLPNVISYGRPVFGKRQYNRRLNQSVADELNSTLQTIATTMEILFRDVLNAAVGKVFLM